MKKKTILFADDSTVERLRTTSLLEEHGYTVLTAEDGQVAIEIYQKEKGEIAAIVSDLIMPKVDGFQFARYNYENDCLPFIACTSLDNAKAAIKLLDYGVQDYVEKPYEEHHLLLVINNVINRASHEHSASDAHEKFPGNVDSVTIPSKLSELRFVCRWLEKKIENFFDPHGRLLFINFFNEFLVNAHEHGNMKLNEEEKMHLIINGNFEERLMKLEEEITATIKVVVSVLKNQVAVSISDEGSGFDYVKYLKPDEEEILRKLELPNGRGILMASQYFDKVFYSHKGATAVLLKKIQNTLPRQDTP